MTWIQAYSGKKFDYIDVQSNQVCIEDVAHALSHTCRFAGHVHEFYSVAQHSFHVANIVPDEDKLWGLLHDAAEAYTGDMVRPLKQILKRNGDIYAQIEDAVEKHVWSQLGLIGDKIPDSVKRADAVMLLTEKRDLLREEEHVWTDDQCADPTIEPMDWKIFCLRPVTAKHLFLSTYRELISKQKGHSHAR